MDRREFLKVTGGTGLALSTGFRFPERRTRTAMQPAVTAPALAATSAPCQFGAFVNPFGADPITAIGAFETLIGRPLAITRHYFTWNISLTGFTRKPIGACTNNLISPGSPLST